MLITGATGFLGFSVLLAALKEGYTIRVAVRSNSHPAKLTSQLEANGLENLKDRLSFCNVPDAGSSNAYDQAVQGITYIIHLAAPLASPELDPTTQVFEPSIKGVRNILESASTQPSVKKVVITASVVSVTDFESPPGEVITADTRKATPEPPFSDGQAAYEAGKVAALNAARDFVRDARPAFEVVNILPTMVYGWDARASKVEDMWNSTNKLLLGVITGKHVDVPLPDCACEVDDVVNIHIQSLKSGVAGDYITLIPNRADDAWDVVQSEFPRAVEKGIFTRGHQANVRLHADVQRTELKFGFKHKSYEDMVKIVAGQYLELAGEAKA